MTIVNCVYRYCIISIVNTFPSDLNDNNMCNIENSNTKYIPSIAVAAIDICGMTNMIKKNDQCLQAIKSLELLLKNAAENRLYNTPSRDYPAESMYEKGFYFGDSVYLFADPTRDIETQIIYLTARCASLIAIGITKGFLIRVGISTGDLRTLSLKLGNKEKKQEIRIGTSMAKAHTLQESQDWIGGVVEGQYSNPPKNINQIPYSVPLKKYNRDINYGSIEALNWVYIIAEMHNNDVAKIKDLVRKRFFETGNSECKKIESKFEQTLKFVEYVFDNDAYLMKP